MTTPEPPSSRDALPDEPVESTEAWEVPWFKFVGASTAPWDDTAPAQEKPGLDKRILQRRAQKKAAKKAVKRARKRARK